MKVSMNDTFNLLFVIIAICLIFCGVLTHCANESKTIYIKKISGYDLVQLEDGHQYLKQDSFYSHSLEHYVDCPKCKNK